MEKNTPRRQWIAIYVALALVAIGGGLLTAYSMTRPAPAPKPFALDWKPKAIMDTKRVVEISAHTEKRYRLAEGMRLVDVEGGPPAYDAETPVNFVMIDAERSEAAKVVVYGLCGDKSDSSCELPGAQSEKRVCLLSHQSFELAYQSFRYLPSKKVVVVMMPFKVEERPIAFYYRRAEFKKLLSLRLPEVMGRQTAPLASDADVCTMAKHEEKLSHFAAMAFVEGKQAKGAPKQVALALVTATEETG